MCGELGRVLETERELGVAGRCMSWVVTHRMFTRSRLSVNKIIFYFLFSRRSRPVFVFWRRPTPHGAPVLPSLPAPHFSVSS
jgi:hypothetical protein